MSDFDSNNKSRIGAFLSLKDKCFYHESERLGIRFHVNNNNLPFIYFSSFFSHMRDVCDLSILFLINEEVSNSIGRKPYPKLIEEVVSEGFYSKKIMVNNDEVVFENIKIKFTLEEIRDLFVNKFNGMLGSQILDFQVSAFSSFEFWVSKIYEMNKEKIESDLMKSRELKYSKLIDKYREASESDKSKILQKIIKLPGGFVSFPDKLNCIFKLVDKDKYRRNINEDKDIISFLRANRNTVHNGGVHKGKDHLLLHNNKSFVLESDKPAYNENYNDLIALIGELVDIYSEILFSLDSMTPDLYTEGQYNTRSLNLLSVACKEFVTGTVEDEIKDELTLSFFNDIGLNHGKSQRLLQHLKDLIPTTDQEIEILTLLSCDLV
ncbi:hypothetical protein WB876_004217 [Vibrio vulnificus]